MRNLRDKFQNMLDLLYRQMHRMLHLLCGDDEGIGTICSLLSDITNVLFVREEPLHSIQFGFPGCPGKCSLRMVGHEGSDTDNRELNEEESHLCWLVFHVQMSW